MPYNHRWLLLLGPLAFLVGGALYLSSPPQYPAPPPAIEPHDGGGLPGDPDSPQIAKMSLPWFRAPLPVAVPRAAAVPAAPLPIPIPKPSVPIDRTSLAYVGAYTDQNGTKTYFFKYLPTGQALVVGSDRPYKGWSLTGATDKAFSLSSASGGLYEVAR